MPYLILTVQRKNIYIRIRYIYIYTITQYIHYKNEGQNDEWYTSMELGLIIQINLKRVLS